MCGSRGSTGEERKITGQGGEVPQNPESIRPDLGLSREQRIARNIEFREAFDSGLSYRGRFLVMFIRKGEGASLRLGVVASKRSFRKAVQRSRAKRLLREAFRLNRFRLGGDVDVVLLARTAIGKVKRAEVEEDLIRVARAAGILNQEGDAKRG